MQNSKSHKNDENKAVQKSTKDNFLIVGIGASAGGVQALKTFFENVPADSNVAYVVILHLVAGPRQPTGGDFADGCQNSGDAGKRKGSRRAESSLRRIAE